ncbi:hypothetical protein AMS68_006338 [Peltaster fructicola]|uniref:Uncharacterized protein n=1 Tax=Peltaster fructicola TaxID=286661 RepID=A0A6H0Y1N4_9PEZI|nr:hypothetical protein AMS68_006338 [Peltaster fructicola]
MTNRYTLLETRWFKAICKQPLYAAFLVQRDFPTGPSRCEEDDEEADPAATHCNGRCKQARVSPRWCTA